MNLRSGLFMAVLLIAAGAYVYKTEYATVAPVEDKQEIVALPGIATKDIQRLTLSKGEETIQIEREGFSPQTVRGNTNFKPKKDTELTWVLSNPPGAPTNLQTVDRILNSLVALKTKTFIEENEVGEDLAVYGLASPTVVMGIEGSFGRKKLSFGKQSSITKRRYLQIEGEKRVLMVDESVYSLISQPVNQIRDTQPIRFNAADIKSISIRRAVPGDAVEFKRGDTGWIASIGDKQVIADPTEADQAFAELGSLTVSRFVDEPEGSIALYGLKEPRATVAVHFSTKADANAPADLIFYLGEGVSIKPKPEGEKQEGELGVAATKAVYAKLVGDPTIYELTSAPLSYLTRTLADFRDKEPLRSVRSADVSSATITLANQQPFTLQREASGWVMKDGETSVPVNQERAQSWFASIVATRVLSYQDAAAAPTDGFADNIVLKLADGSEIKVSVGKELGSGAANKQVKPAERPKWVNFDIKSGTGGVAVLPAQKVADILRGRDFFKSV